MIVRELRKKDEPQAKQLVDLVFGENFFGSQYFILSLQQSCSFVLLDEEKLVGLRMTFAPGTWLQETHLSQNQGLWPCSPDKVAYFKTICLDPKVAGNGWGRKLSEASMLVLKKIGAEAVLCHSWLEEPNQRSIKYLRKLGFKPVTEVKDFWRHIPYKCVVCHPSDCRCTAVEMLLPL